MYIHIHIYIYEHASYSVYGRTQIQWFGMPGSLGLRFREVSGLSSSSSVQGFKVCKTQRTPTLQPQCHVNMEIRLLGC